MSKRIRRQIFLDDLKKRGHQEIDWEKSEGYKVRFIYGDIEGYVEIIKYIKENNSHSLRFKYNDEEFVMLIGDFRECSFGKILGMYTSEFKYKIGQAFKDDKRDITIIDREYRPKEQITKNGNKSITKKKWYKYACNVCSWTEGWIEEGNLNKGIGCSCCYGRTPVLGINSIWDTDKWMIPIVGEEFAKSHTHGSHDEIYPICPTCGRIKHTKMKVYNIYIRKSMTCSCSDNIPYPEKFTFSVLEQLELDFQTQLTNTTFKWCNKYRYDFYFRLNDEDCIIETHGMQHYEDTSGVYKKTLEKEQENDRLKKQLALSNGIKEENYIVIDCRYSTLEWIKKHTFENNKLDKLFDLNKIDWLKCSEYACNNLVKIACEYKKNNNGLTTVDIGKFMKLDCQTIRKYLKEGTELGWCSYDGQLELKKNISNTGKGLGKNLIILKDEIFLGIFKSTQDLFRKSEELFKTKLWHGSVSSVCLGKQKFYKGFSFKYIKDLTPEDYITYDIENKLKEIY